MNLPVFNKNRSNWFALVLIVPFIFTFGTVHAAGITIGSGSSISVGSHAIHVGCHDLVNNGQLNLGSGVVDVTNNVANNNQFNGNSGLPETSTIAVVDECGDGSITFDDSTDFYNLTMMTTAGKTVSIESGEEQKIANDLVFTGAAGNFLTLRSSIAGAETFTSLSQGGTQLIDWVDVQDNFANLPYQHIAHDFPAVFNSVDSGGNFRWFVTTASWRVQKIFEGDAGGASADITLTCTSGNVNNTGTTSDTQTVSGGGFATFEVHDFSTLGLGNTRCYVSEDNPTDGFYATLEGSECDVDPVVHQTAYTDCRVVNRPTRATFHVVKGFNDDNPNPVAVTLSCDTGLPLEQTKMIVDDNDPHGGVDFVVVDFTTGTLDCDITEEEVAGYTPWYTNRSVGFEERDDGCFYSDVVGGADHSCFISNDLLPVRIDVTKRWFDDHPEFNNPTFAKARWNCYNVSDAGNQGDGFFGCDGDDCGNLHFYGTQSSDSFQVYPDWDGSTYCSVEEKVRESGVESDDRACARLYVIPGVGNACTITNTRFYEGIPTLSQYGLAILALLMLGAGLVGFRRFS
jgi:hypothetical protein